MGATKAYNRKNWAAYPSKETPMTAANLNVMDKGIDDIDNRVVSLMDQQDGIQTGLTDVQADMAEAKDDITSLNNNLTKIGLKKLWENPNPSASFSAQNITLSSDDYDYLIFTAKAIYNFNGISSNFTPKGYIGIINNVNTSNSMMMGTYRYFYYVNDTTINIRDCYNVFPSKAEIVNNDYIIPYAIYGGHFAK